MTTEFRFSEEEYRNHATELDDALEQLRRHGIDSRTLHGRIDRGWTRWSSQRRAAHRELVREFWDQHSPLAPTEGRALLVAGVDGAGKTTLRQDPQRRLNTGQYLVLDADEIAEDMARRGMIPVVDGFSPMEASALVHEEAWEITDRLAQKAYQEKRNVLWEIPMNSMRSKERVAALNDAGYAVDGGFVDAPTDVARRRALLRHRQEEEAYRDGHGLGGRYVPESVYLSCKPDAAPEDTQRPLAPAGTPVRELVEQFENGTVDLDDFAHNLLGRWHARSGVESRPHDWVDTYRRCEGMPDDDDLFWVHSAEDRGVLTAEQTEHLMVTIDCYTKG